MAFLNDGEPGESFDFVKEAQRKIDALNTVATERDRVFEENQEMPLQLILWIAGGTWAIYHFLIKR